MIVCHNKRFIFLANRKTASTSIAIALSSACSPNDVITPLGKDESIRRKLGYTSPRNFIPWWNFPRYLLIEATKKLKHQNVNQELKKVGLHTHISMQEALQKSYIKKRHHDTYFSFCFIRNPWDLVISRYHWGRRQSQGEGPSLDQFIFSEALVNWAQKNRSIYTINGDVCVRRLCLYENAQAEINRIFEELSLTGNPQLAEAKRNTRTDRRPYREILSSAQAARIADIFAEEIKFGNYSF